MIGDDGRQVTCQSATTLTPRCSRLANYVDLNAIRADLAASLEESDLISIQPRFGLPTADGSEPLACWRSVRAQYTSIACTLSR